MVMVDARFIGGAFNGKKERPLGICRAV